jgi:hypothetical protein
MSNTEAPEQRVDIVQVDRALESWRDAGFDLTAAVGEVVDNSIEAGATIVRVQTFPRGERPKAIDTVAFSDDGNGVQPEILPHVLSLGFSTRYGQRSGMGRFGVGLKLAGLSHARRIEVYSRHASDNVVWAAYLDLDEVADGTQTHITSHRLKAFPPEFASLMASARGDEHETGTLVVWRKVDRLQAGGRFNTDLSQRLSEVRSFLARAYRRFLDGGVSIELNGRNIDLHDPTFQLDSPRVVQKLQAQARGTVVSHDEIEIDGFKVKVTVALVPDELILPRGGGNDRLLQDMNIPENEGRISFLRQGREINYDQVAKMLPGGVHWGDRYIGIEVEFPAALDEYFQVRHVKRGVVPVDRLRAELRTTLRRPVLAARKRIQARWDALDLEAKTAAREHDEAVRAAAAAEQTAPRGRAGADMTEQEQEQAVEEVAKELTRSLRDRAAASGDPAAVEEAEAASEKVREAIAEAPFTLVDGSWPGKEMFDITHLNGKAIIRLNHSHPYVREMYGRMRTLMTSPGDELSTTDLAQVVAGLKVGFDLLFVAYAKAENMHRDPDAAYADLRMFWGQAAASYVREAFAR